MLPFVRNFLMKASIVIAAFITKFLTNDYIADDMSTLSLSVID